MAKGDTPHPHLKDIPRQKMLRPQQLCAISAGFAWFKIFRGAAVTREPWSPEVAAEYIFQIQYNSWPPGPQTVQPQPLQPQPLPAQTYLLEQ